MRKLWDKTVVSDVVSGTLMISALGLTAFAHGQASSPAKAVASTASVSASAEENADQPIQPAGAPNKTSDITLDPASLVPDLPPLPPAPATLIGGTIERIDPVQDEITIRVFGGGKVKTLFDPRTNISRDGKPESIEGLKAGQRIYADTILLNDTVFARNIRLTGSSTMGESQGVVVAYRADKNSLVLRDPLSPAPMNLHLTPGTTIVRDNRSAPTSDLVPGTLVSVNFLPQPGDGPVARQVTILITPGTEFSFTGRVTALDLHLKLLVVTSITDRRMYDIHFDPAVLPISSDLREGAEVTVLTRYDGTHYVARALTVNKSPTN